MATVAILPNDSWPLICSYLSLDEIAELYATNDHRIMRRLVEPGVAVAFEVTRTISPKVARFLCDNRSLKQLTAKATYMPGSTSFSNGPPKIADLSTCMRILRGISHSSLTSLQITSNIVSDPNRKITESESFASLFPNLTELRFPASPGFFASRGIHNDINMGLLLSELPQTLQKLHLESPTANPRFSALPSSLTSLTIMSCPLISLYAQYPSQYPTLALIELLHAKTPNLTHLSTRVASPGDGSNAPHYAAFFYREGLQHAPFRYGSIPPPGRAPTQQGPFLPKLASLSLLLYASGTVEFNTIIKCLPSVEKLQLSCINVTFGPSIPAGEEPFSFAAEMHPHPNPVGNGRDFDAQEVVTLFTVFPPNLRVDCDWRGRNDAFSLKSFLLEPPSLSPPAHTEFVPH